MVASPRLSEYFYTRHTNRTTAAADAATSRPRGFPAGTPRNRLSPQQRRTIIDMLKITPNAAAMAREFVAAKLGAMSHPTVCTIKRDAIARGEIRQTPKAAP
jgi:hypothetical protein